MDIAPDLLRIRDPSDGLKIHTERKGLLRQQRALDGAKRRSKRLAIPSHVLSRPLVHAQYCQ